MKSVEEFFEEWCKDNNIPLTYKLVFKDAYFAGYRTGQNMG